MFSVAPLMSFSPSTTTFVCTCIVRAFDLSTSSTLLAVFYSRPTFFPRTLEQVGVQPSIYLLFLLASTQASRGHLESCEQTLRLFSKVITDGRINSFFFHPIITGLISSVGLAITSLCSASGAHSMVPLISEISIEIQNREGTNINSSTDKLFSDQCESILSIAEKNDCPAAVMAQIS